MPKKQPKNAFAFFMFAFREEQKRNGITYASMAEVATAAGPVWQASPPHVRSRYENMAKEEKFKGNVLETKYTSTGVSLAYLQQLEQEKLEAEQAELKDIKNMVKLKAFDNRILTEDIYLMDVNFYCKVDEDYLIGESTVLRFNLKDGIRDNYHIAINPGRIPLGYGYEVKLGCQEYGLEPPDEEAPRSNFMEILANTIDYLKEKDSNVKTLPPIFTMPDKVAPVMNFIQQMCRRASEDDTLFRVYKLDTLFFTMVNALKSSSDDGFPRESLALALLKKDSFGLNRELGCEMHEQGEKYWECSKARATRWAFTVLDKCCRLVDVDPVPGQHLPHEFDVAAIVSHKEQTRARVGWQEGRGRAGSSLSSARGGGSASTSTVTSCNTTLNDSQPLSSLNNSNKEKRTNPPLRMPTDYVSARLGAAPALISEEDFPPLSSGAGRGRRNLSNKFGKMNMQN